jgi:hypothetical protein
VAIRKAPSATQPGRGIRKIIDLFHGLTELLEKADKHTVTQRLSPEDRENVDRIDFVNMTQRAIKEERKEYVQLM